MVPDVVKNKAVAAGAHQWLADLPNLVAEMEQRWHLTAGEPYTGGTEAYVARADMSDGQKAVLKLLIPHHHDAARHEITVLELASGAGCAKLHRFDVERSAMLMERLGPSLFDLGVDITRRHEILCDAAQKVWRPAPDCGLPTGATKGAWLIDQISQMWVELGEPCSRRTIHHALECARSRIEAHEDTRSVLVHGDVHEWNTLESVDGYKLIDPDGLLAEPEYDLGVMMREDPVELMASGAPKQRSRWLADRTGLDETAIWEWGVVERVSTGLLATKIDLQPVGRQMLDAADQIAALESAP